MTEKQKKRLRQRLEADIRAGLIILALLLIGYIAGRVTARAAWGGCAAGTADKPLTASLERGELPRLIDLGEFTATYYCCEAYPHICGTGDGLTATGVPVEPGIVAVDPSVIPLGSVVSIDGAEYLAADTGSAIRGNRVDIAVPTHEEALALGVRAVAVYLVPGT